MGYLRKGKKNKRRKGIYNVIDHGQAYETNLMAGRVMTRKIRNEKAKHFIGERIILNRQIDRKEKGRTIGGVVIGIYPHFLLLDCGFYKTTISYKDLVLGAKTYDS